MIASGSSFIDHIICTNCKTKFNKNELLHLCPKCSKVLFVVYDIEKASQFVTKSSLEKRKRKDLWRIHEIMPVLDNKFRFTLNN